MCKLTNFDYNNNQVRTATKGEEILFCLVDCCNVLNLKQPTRVLERLNRDGVTQIKGVSKTTNQYGITTEQEVILNFISEPNLYRVIFRSDKLEAVKFQDWVFNEVLPALRKTGKYEVGEVGPTKTELTQSKPSQSQAELVNSIGPTNRFPSQANPSVLVPQIDKSSFHTFSTYLFKLRYAFYNDTIYILLSDVDRFLEITRLNGRDKVRTKDNYTIHHILCDYSIVPFCVPIEGTNIFNNMCLTVPQLLELCYNLKTKRSEMLLEAFANNNFEKHIAENHKKEIEDKKLLTITA